MKGRDLALNTLAFLVMLALCVGAVAWVQSEPEIKNCPSNHVCRWIEVDVTAKKCLKNCGAL